MAVTPGETVDKCWASNRPGTMSDYAACDRETGEDPLGLCPKHRAEIVPAQPALPAPAAQSAA